MLPRPWRGWISNCALRQTMAIRRGGFFKHNPWPNKWVMIMFEEPTSANSHCLPESTVAYSATPRWSVKKLRHPFLLFPLPLIKLGKKKRRQGTWTITELYSECSPQKTYSCIKLTAAPGGTKYLLTREWGFVTFNKKSYHKTHLIKMSTPVFK